jgi:hypothetical protein
MKPLQDAIVRTLLYYDIWHHPLTAREVFRFLPVNSISFEAFEQALNAGCREGRFLEHEGYFFVPGKSPAIVSQRALKEHHARGLWRIARLVMHLIRRFPFVRAVFVSGDLSKNVATRKSDIDFFIITEPDRLWIARTLLILFKKIFLLNRKKYFCLNSFASADQLVLDEKNIFLATEIATLRPLNNAELFSRYQQANAWIREYFPNFTPDESAGPAVCNSTSLVQRLLEYPFRFIPAGRLDSYLLGLMEQTWARRYPEFDDETRRRIFRCTKTESRAYAGNFQDKILAVYEQRLREFGVGTEAHD